MPQWNSTPAYPTPLLLVLTGFALMLLPFLLAGAVETLRTLRRGRGR